nr:hypothetical protein [Tanacetum cinerariifolium]
PARAGLLARPPRPVPPRRLPQVPGRFRPRRPVPPPQPPRLPGQGPAGAPARAGRPEPLPLRGNHLQRRLPARRLRRAQPAAVAAR